MADHRAEQILAQIAVLLDGLPTTGTNVERGRVYPLSSTVNAGLSIYGGPDTPAAESPWPMIYSTLTVHVEASVRGSAWGSILNQVRLEVVKALMADLTLGLAFVQKITEGATADPQHDHGETPIATQVFDFQVEYQRSYSDPSQ